MQKETHKRTEGPKVPKIDMHTHIIPENMPDFSTKFGYEGFIYLDHHTEGKARMMQGNTFFREIGENTWDPKLRIREYADLGVDKQVISIIPVLFYYWARPHDAAYTSRFFNETLSQITEEYPEHYYALGTLPMQDTKLAVEELKHIKELGLQGIQIGSNIQNKNLESLEFFPIYEACQDLGLCLFVHPWNMMGMKHMRKYWLPWLVGMPAETSRAICSMLFGGVFERFPDLRVCFAHAGGSFSGTFGRIVHGFNCRPDLVAVDNSVPPEEYIGRFWVDCITHDGHSLEEIVRFFGKDKVMLGSDYPFPLGDLEIGAFIEESQLDQSTKEAIYYHAVLDWLGVEEAQSAATA